MPDELQPRGTFKGERPNHPDLEKMSLEELQNLVEWPRKMEEHAEKVASQYVPAEPTPSEAPQVVPEPPREEVPPEPQPEPEVEKPPEEPQAATPPVEQPPDEAAVLLARLEAYEASQKALEARLAGRQAGENGYIKQLQREIAELRASRESAGEMDAEPVAPRQAAPAPDASQSAITTWAVSQAMQAAAAAFSQEHSDMPELNDGIKAHLERSGYDPKRILLSDDPIAAGRETTRVLEEAYWAAKAERKAKVVEELQRKRADSMRGIEEAKKKAAVSSAGVPAPAKPAPKRPEDMSLEDLTARVARFANRGR